MASPSHHPEIQLINEAEILRVLRKGKMQEHGLLPYSSNHSFLVTVSQEGYTLPAVYKPQGGEAPLYDFEWGTLCKREAAAFLVSDHLGWGLVPPTVLREGKHGLGSVQFYIDHDPNIHYFSIQADARFADALRKLTLFDFVINNADRKSGHCLIGNDRRLWAIDHGICFHVEYKLRTVIWEFANQPIADSLLSDLEQFGANLADSKSALHQQLHDCLHQNECEVFYRRLQHLLKTRIFPPPQPHRRNYPWPPV
jgi:uncharacterized repeat protein (TIGR03843 family)